MCWRRSGVARARALGPEPCAWDPELYVYALLRSINSDAPLSFWRFARDPRSAASSLPGGHPSQPCEHICAPVVSHDYGCVCLKLSKALGQCGCFERATPRHLAQPAEYYCCCRARGRSWRASRLSKTSCPSSCPFSSCPFSSCASCLSCPSYSSLWCAPRAQRPAPYDDQS